MVEVICAIIAAVSAVMVAYIGRKTELRAKKSEDRANLRQEESLLQLELMNANTQLTQAIGNAVLGGHNNGNVAIAKKNVEDALAKYQEFHNKLALRVVNK